MNEGRFIKLKVFAHSKKNCIIQTGQDSFKIYVRQKARQGAANKKALELLAAKLNKNAGHFKIIKGAKMPGKIVKIL
jgi:uncharacterized protein YggU (UPF0235/DUF167 family)